jgi:5'-nucleotidase
MVAPYKIYEFGQHSVAVVGWITPDTETSSSPGPTVTFEQIEPAVQEAVDELTQMQIDVIIGLSHAGYARDQEMAQNVEGLDIIVGGHSHTYLSDTDPDAAGPYPTVVESPNGEPVLVVTAGYWGKYLGELTIEFDENGVPDTWTGQPILLDASVEQNPDVLELVDEYAADIDSFGNEVIGETLVDIDGSSATCRFGECLMGNFVADIMLWESKSQSIQIAMLNGGGIRAGILAGDVTVGQVLTVFPFENSLATMGLLGQDVLAALEFGVSRADDPSNEGTGRFLQVAGLRYEFDPNRAVGSRILSVEVLDENDQFQPLDTEAVYQMVTIDYLRGGGDGYTIFEENAIDPDDYGRLLTDAILDYFDQFTPVSPELDGRITID